jgi:hypothetical protein
MQFVEDNSAKVTHSACGTNKIHHGDSCVQNCELNLNSYHTSGWAIRENEFIRHLNINNRKAFWRFQVHANLLTASGDLVRTLYMYGVSESWIIIIKKGHEKERKNISNKSFKCKKKILSYRKSKLLIITHHCLQIQKEKIQIIT